MATFTDGFDRANGSPGGNWVTISGTPTIEGNWLRQSGAGSCYAYNTTPSNSGRHECVITASFNYGANNQAGVLVKVVPGTTTCYLATITYSAPNYSLSISKGVPGAGSAVASTVLASAPAGVYTLRLVWDNGHLTATVGGIGSLEADDSQYANGTDMGVKCYSNTAMVDVVTMITGAAVQFDVTPDAIPNYGSTTVLTFTGTNTDWTSGTPGSPIFTCDHGTLSDQVVASATSATATYDPGSYLGPVVFTDPSTGLTDTSVVTSNIGVLPPPGTSPFNDQFVALANRTPVWGDQDRLATDETIVIPAYGEALAVTLVQALGDMYTMMTNGIFAGPGVTLQSLITDVLVTLTGQDAQAITPYYATRHTSLKEELDWTRDYLNGLRGDNQETLKGIIDAIQGAPLQTLDSLSDQIANISAGSNADVLAAIAAVRGSGNPDLAQVVASLGYLMTFNNYDLGDVLDAIAGVQTTATSTASAISSMNTTLTNGIAAILDAIDALPTGSSTVNLPLWPGLGNATIGPPVDLADQLVMDGPMDGLLIDVSSGPPRGGGYNVGGVRLDYGQMRVAFETDNGYIEPWQYFGFRKAIYTPSTMERASKARFQLLGGTVGTARTFLRS